MEGMEVKIYVITKGSHVMGNYQIIGCCTTRAKAEQFAQWYNGRMPAVSGKYDPGKAVTIEVYDTEDIVDSSRWRMK